MFECRMLRRIFGPEREDVTRVWKNCFSSFKSLYAQKRRNPFLILSIEITSNHPFVCPKRVP
jgi:hypothetical protein